MIIYFLPLITCLLGWLSVVLALRLFWRKQSRSGFTFRNTLHTYKPLLAKEAGKYVSGSMLRSDALGRLISGPEILRSLRPELERNVTVFLNQKLKEKWPMVGMFLNDQALDKMKAGLMEELDRALPGMLTQLAATAGRHLPVEDYVAQEVMNIHENKIQDALSGHFRRIGARLGLAGAAAGLIMGIIVCLLLKIFSV